MAQKLSIQKLSTELETIYGPELYALKGGFYGGYSDGPTIPWATGENDFTYNVYGDNLELEEYRYRFPGATKDTILYRADDSIDADTRSNCLGFALTGGEFTIVDNPYTTNVDEGKITREDMSTKFGYVQCEPWQADIVIVYSGTSENSEAVHAGIYNPYTNTFDAKGGGSEYGIRYGMVLDQFLNPYDDVSYGSSSDTENVVYYRKKVGAGGY